PIGPRRNRRAFFVRHAQALPIWFLCQFHIRARLFLLHFEDTFPFGRVADQPDVDLCAVAFGLLHAKLSVTGLGLMKHEKVRARHALLHFQGVIGVLVPDGTLMAELWKVEDRSVGAVLGRTWRRLPAAAIV